MFGKKRRGFFALSLPFATLNFKNVLYLILFKNNSKDMISQFNNLSSQLNTDQLTNLFNRRCFFNDINKQIEATSSVEPQFFLLFIDLDGFKTINDELGHTAGDYVLKEYSRRLKEHTTTKNSAIYRMGGDEFVIIFNNKTFEVPLNENDIIKISTEILDITEEPFKIKEEKRRLSQSIGIAGYKKGSTAEEILIYADTAMYEAKRQGKNRAVYYSDDLHNKVKNRNEIIRLLKIAIEENEFHLVFQPQMIKDKNSEAYFQEGAEVLMRWESKTIGIVSPQVFIPIAEEAGLMGMIDTWLIEESAKKIKEMKEKGINTTFSINVSAKQFSNINLPDTFKNTLQKYDIHPSAVIIEITESATIKEPELAKAILRKFRGFGFGISIDDFGTGYSSISYLRQFPVTEIKFDKSFTKNINIDEQDEIIISGLSNIAQQLHLNIVMEGVETEKQISWIQKHIPCAIIQGYFFSKPLKIEDFIEFARNHQLKKCEKIHHNETEMCEN